MDVQIKYISEDEKYLVVLGQKHSYFFDMPEQVKTAMQSSYGSFLELDFYPLLIKSNGIASGRYNLNLGRTVPEQYIDAAVREMGFKKRPGSNGALLTGDLTGRRYEGFPAEREGVILGKALESTRGPRIEEERQWPDRLWRYPLVPFTLVADGVAWGVILVSVVIFCISTGQFKNCHA